MKGVAEALAFAACVLAMAYCTVHADTSSKEMTMKKADVCTQGGGRYDFNWGSCNYEAVK